MTTKALTTPMGQHLAAQARHAWASGLEAIVASDEELLAVEQQAAQAERERIRAAVEGLGLAYPDRTDLTIGETNLKAGWDAHRAAVLAVIEGKEPK